MTHLLLMLFAILLVFGIDLYIGHQKQKEQKLLRALDDISQETARHIIYLLKSESYEDLVSRYTTIIINHRQWKTKIPHKHYQHHLNSINEAYHTKRIKLHPFHNQITQN